MRGHRKRGEAGALILIEVVKAWVYLIGTFARWLYRKIVKR